MENHENKIGELDYLTISFLTNEISTDDELKFLEWLNKSNSNREHFNNLRNAWILSGSGEIPKQFNIDYSFRNLKKQLSDREISSLSSINRGMYRWFHVAAAGLLFFMLGSLVTWFSGRKSEPSVIAQEATEIICPYGSKSKIILPDGSEVWLNAGSSLRYENNFNKDKRDVSLVGEAFFTVTTNKEKPFIVNTKGMVVRAFGTEFNVKSYPEEKSESAILVEGKIDVEIKNTGKESDIFNLKPNERLVLRSEKVEITSQTETNSNPQKRIETTPVKVDYITNIKPVLYTSWKDEQWIIESEPLETLVPMLERRYNMKFRFVNDDLKKFKFTGTLQNETIDQIMEALRMTAPIEYKIVKDSVTLRLDEKLSKQYSRIISRK